MDGLYFIAIVVEGEVGEKIMTLKQKVADKYGCKAPLRSPPHITLHMPFRIKPSKEPFVVETLDKLAQKSSPFDLKTNGFNCFKPRVIYIEVSPSDLLDELQEKVVYETKSKLHLHNPNYKNRGFTPHITIAFRDLSRPNFNLAWDEFKDQPFDYSISCTAISLLKHDSKKWQVARNFSLVSKS